MAAGESSGELDLAVVFASTVPVAMEDGVMVVVPVGEGVVVGAVVGTTSDGQY